MKFILPIIALAGSSIAHNFVTHFHHNGDATTDVVRQANSADPILDIYSAAMACNNVQGFAPKKAVVKGGDIIGFEWRTDRNIAPADYPLKDGYIPVGVTDDSHKGPCSVYMKKVTDALTAEATGDGWFKVSEDGLGPDGSFCTDRIRLANAPQPGVIPVNIEPGDYLLRAEMITLNNAGPKSMGGLEAPQFYTGCAQVTVEGTSGTNPDTVSIPGYLSMSSPGMIYDIWNTPSGVFTDYTVPGPAPLVNLVPFQAGVPASTIGGSAPTPAPVASEPAASSSPAYTSSSKAAENTEKASPTSTKAATVTTPVPDYSGDAPVETPAHSEDTPAETPTHNDDAPTETPDYSEDTPAETSTPVYSEEAPANTGIPQGAIPVTVTCTTFVTKTTTVTVRQQGGEATGTTTVYAAPTHGHRGGKKAHRKRHGL